MVVWKKSAWQSRTAQEAGCTVRLQRRRNSAGDRNGEVVSSTTIRQAVEAGDLRKAAEMLGRAYTILGTVVRGDDLGKKIGFPTANLSAHNEQFPPNGVYFAQAILNGVIYLGVVNLGYRPTVSSEKDRVLEIHLFDFDRDIYGSDL